VLNKVSAELDELVARLPHYVERVEAACDRLGGSRGGANAPPTHQDAPVFLAGALGQMSSTLEDLTNYLAKLGSMVDRLEELV